MDVTDYIMERLFVCFDINETGTINIEEFLSGVALLCQGTIDEKLDLCFEVY